MVSIPSIFSTNMELKNWNLGPIQKRPEIPYKCRLYQNAYKCLILCLYVHIIKHFFFQQIFFGRGISDYTYYTHISKTEKLKIGVKFTNLRQQPRLFRIKYKQNEFDKSGPKTRNYLSKSSQKQLTKGTWLTKLNLLKPTTKTLIIDKLKPLKNISFPPEYSKPA